MPIRAELRHFYRGPDWQATRKRILDRAGNKCEQCRKPNHAIVYTFRQLLNFGNIHLVRKMYWIREGRKVWRDERGSIVRSLRFPAIPRKIRVVLTIAHLNHVAGDDRDENLKALCQWCHLNFDKLHHHETRATRKDAARPLLAEASL